MKRNNQTDLQKTVNRLSLSDQATQLIKEKILSLKYLPGQRLVVDDLAEEINVSRTPVREGLKALVVQGLIQNEGKGYTVFKPTAREIINLFHIRRSLEALAAKQAASRMTEIEIKDLKNLYDDSVIIKSGENLFRLVEIDIQFHDMLISGAKNERLAQILNSIQEQCWLIREWGYGDNEVTVEETTKIEHQKIIDLVAGRDAEGAAEAMETHLINGEKRTLELPNIKKLL